MEDRKISLISLALALAVIAVAIIWMPGVNRTPAARGAASPIAAIDALPPSAAGSPTGGEWSVPPAPAAKDPSVYMGGVTAVGRVERLYVRAAENVLLDYDRAPQHLRANGQLFADVQFPDPLANGMEAARAQIIKTELAVRPGDVIAMRFAHKQNTQFFPVREATQVTSIVARANTEMAADYERRILARAGVRSPVETALGIERRTESAAFSATTSR